MNAPFKVPTQRLPDILLAGETVEQILNLLSNAILYARSQDGSMRPFIDPMPVTQILGAAVNAALQAQQDQQLKEE